MSGKLKQIKREFEKIQDEIQCQKLLLRDIVLIYRDENEVEYLQEKIYVRQKYIDKCNELIGSLNVITLPAYPLKDETKDKWSNLKIEIEKLKNYLEALNYESQSLITGSLTSIVSRKN
uniref:hypothetical protein n=1 Tax=Megamonas funiformis TaxID=437897 RepID=UPI002675104B|nr:hypothetical protein [Megamonas funiformis]